MVRPFCPVIDAVKPAHILFEIKTSLFTPAGTGNTVKHLLMVVSVQESCAVIQYLP